MDQYILIIYRDPYPLKDQLLLIDHIKSILPSEEEINYCFNCESSLLPFLYRRTVFLACIPVSHCGLANHIWLNVVGSITHQSIFSSFKSNNLTELDLIETEAVAASEAIHTLADQLPAYGTYHLDVFFGSNVLGTADIRQYLDFEGALYRLHIWHNAYLHIAPSFKDNILLEWNANICHFSENHCNAPLWRGNIQFGTKECNFIHGLQGWSIQISPQETMKWPIFSKTSFDDASICQQKEILVISHMEVIDLCHLSAVPIYLFSPVTLQLVSTERNSRDNVCFYNYLNHDPETAFVLKMRYSMEKEPILPAEDNNTASFKKAVLDGNISCPEVAVVPSSYLIFVATRNNVLQSSINLYLLIDCDMFNINIDSQLTTHFLSLSGPSDQKLEKYSSLSQNIPHYGSAVLKKYLHSMKVTQENLLQEWIAHKKKNCPNNSFITVEEFKAISAHVKQTVNSQFASPRKILNQDKEIKYVLGESDPSDWPERLYLLHKQIQTDKQMSDNIGGNDTTLVHGLLQPQKGKIISATDVQKYFLSSGHGKEQNSLEQIIVNHPYFISCTEQEVAQMQWPEILYHKFHDLYYNADTSCEDQEIKNSKLKSSLINDETASTCSSDWCIGILPLNETKKTSSFPRNDQTPSKRKSSKRKGVSITRKYLPLRSSKLSGSQMTASPFRIKEQSSSLKRKADISLVDLPVRRSPRRQRHEPPQLTRMTIAPKRDELSERHKMKLREAVVFALGSYDISMSHPLFKSTAKKLFAVCKPFVKDIIGKGSTTSQMKKIAAAHAKQVVDFEREKCL